MIEISALITINCREKLSGVRPASDAYSLEETGKEIISRFLFSPGRTDKDKAVYFSSIKVKPFHILIQFILLFFI